VQGGGGCVDCVCGEVGTEVEALWRVGVSIVVLLEDSEGRTKISANGLEAMNRCGRSNNSLALCFKLSPKVFLPLAFSMMPLSIIVMMGATSAPAAPAASASTPIRNPSFDVFQCPLAAPGSSFVPIREPVFEVEEDVIGSGSVGLGMAAGMGVSKAGTGPASAPAALCIVVWRSSFCADVFKAPILSSPIAASCDD
jgi:hypothetical protein